MLMWKTPTKILSATLQHHTIKSLSPYKLIDFFLIQCLITNGLWKSLFHHEQVSSGGALQRMPCTNARAVGTVRWTCTCAGNARSVGCGSARRWACWLNVSRRNNQSVWWANESFGTLFSLSYGHCRWIMWADYHLFIRPSEASFSILTWPTERRVSTVAYIRQQSCPAIQLRYKNRHS